VTAGHGSLRSVNRGGDLCGVGGLAWPARLGLAQLCLYRLYDDDAGGHWKVEFFTSI